MKRTRLLIIAFITEMCLISFINVSIALPAGETSVFIPPGDAPVGSITITDAGIDVDITVTFADIADMAANSSLDWYTETIVYKENTYVCSGIDPLNLLEYFDVCHAGNIGFQSGDYGYNLDTQQIQYGLKPRNDENDPENLKILLCMAIDDTWLPDGTAWADDGPIRLVCPSNNLWEYESSAFVKSVDTIDIVSYYRIPIKFDGTIVGHIDLDNATDTSLFNYTSYDIVSGGEALNYAGPTVKSIAEQFSIDLSAITGVRVNAVDFTETYYLTWSKFVNGYKDAMLAMEYEGEPVGYGVGPLRLLGGDLQKWESIKFIWSLNFVTTEEIDTVTSTSTSTSSSSSNGTTSTATNGFGYIWLVLGLSIISIPAVRRRRE